MDFEEAQQAIVSKAEAAREIEKHGHNPQEFFAEIGERAEYTGAEVLAWLGY
jgi:hypothetical protein